MKTRLLIDFNSFKKQGTNFLDGSLPLRGQLHASAPHPGLQPRSGLQPLWACKLGEPNCHLHLDQGV